MKKLILVIVILFSFTSFAQLVSAELHFIDGKVKTGLGRINIISDKIIFRKNKGAEKQKFNHYDISRLILTKDSIASSFRYKKTSGKRAPKLLQVIKENNNLSLYALVTESNYLSSYGLVGALVSTAIDANKINYEYYFVKNNEPKAHFFGNTQSTSRKRLIEIIKKHFKDCANLIARSEDKEFKAKDIPLTVNHYNNNCSN